MSSGFDEDILPQGIRNRDWEWFPTLTSDFHKHMHIPQMCVSTYMQTHTQNNEEKGKIRACWCTKIKNNPKILVAINFHIIYILLIYKNKSISRCI